MISTPINSSSVSRNVAAMLPENECDTTSLVFSGNGSGAVLASNGFIYTIPSGSGAIRVIDPNSLSVVDGIALTGAHFGICSRNDKIFLTNTSSSNIAVVDLKTKVVSNVSTGVSDLVSLWWGGCLHPNGRVYFTPHNSSVVVSINTTTLAVRTFGSLPLNGSKYCGCILAPNGKMYCPPFTANDVLIIDPILETATTMAYAGTGKYVSGCLARNGLIYCAPHSGNTILVIDARSDTVTTRTIICYSNAPAGLFYGCVYAPSNRIYFVPGTSDRIMTLDVETEAVNTLSLDLSTGYGSLHFIGAVVAPSGRVFMVPYEAGKMLVVKTGLPKTTSSWFLDPCFNKL